MATENVVGIKIQASGAAAVKAEFGRVDAALKATQARAEAASRAMAAMGHGLARGTAAAARAGVLAVAAGTTVLTAALIKGSSAVIQMGDALDELHARTSVSVSNLAVLQQAFALSGVGAERVGDAISKMLRTLADAEDGDALSDRLADMGVSLARIRSLDPAAQFETLSRAIAGIRDPAEQTAAAVALFGRSGAELLPLFKDGGAAIATAKTQLGGLPAVLERNSEEFAKLADATDGWHLKLLQLGGGFLDEVLPAFDGLADRINRLDLTDLGQRIGAFSVLLTNSLQNGTFGDFLALNLEAGFEQFMAFVRQNFLGSSFWSGLGVVLVTVAYDFAKALAEGVSLMETPFLAVIDYAGMLLKSAFLGAADALGEAIVSILNIEVDAWNTLFGTSIDRFTYTAANKAAANWQESWDRASAFTQTKLNLVKATLDDIKNGYRADVGLSPESEGGTATERLSKAIQTQRDLNAAEQEAARIQRETESGYERATQALEDQRAAAQAVDEELANMEADAEDWVARLDRAKVISDALVQDAVIRSTYAGRVGQDFGDFQFRQQAEDQTGFGGAGPGAIAGLQQSLIDFGTTAQQVGEAIRQNIGGAIDAVSTGITSAIMQTKTWGEAFLDVGRAILENVINAIIKMAVTWIAQRLIMAAAGRAIAAATAASLAPIALAQSAIWATPATLATIASYGGAAAAAPGEIALAQAATLANSMAGFAGGGYTGDISADAIAGAVHGQEFVFSAPMTAHLGREDLEALHRNEAEIVRPGAGGSGTKFNVAVMSSRAEASAFLRSSEGRAVVLDIFRRNRHEFL